jgi:hypothetical protein
MCIVHIRGTFMILSNDEWLSSTLTKLERSWYDVTNYDDCLHTLVQNYRLHSSTLVICHWLSIVLCIFFLAMYFSFSDASRSINVLLLTSKCWIQELD